MKNRVLSVMLIFLLTMSILPAFAGTPTVPNNCTGNATGGTTVACTLTISATNDVIVVGVQANDGQTNTHTSIVVTGVADGGDSFAKQIGLPVSVGANCLAGNCYDSEIWSAKALSSGAKTVTVTLDHSTPSDIYSVEIIDVKGILPTATFTASSSCTSVCPTSIATSTTNSFSAGSIEFSSLFADCTDTTPFCTAGAGFTMLKHASPVNGASEYRINGSSPTDYPWVQSASGNFIDVGAIFGPAPPGTFTCAITNMDGGNYLIAGNNKLYDFRCTVQSNALSLTNSLISDVRIAWNDSVHNIIAEYSNNSRGFTGFLLKNGSGIVALQAGAVTNSYNSSNGVRTMVVNFLFSLTLNVVDSLHRGIYLFALNNNFVTRGYELVKPNYFNTYNKGGVVEEKVSGTCSVPAGADTFQTLCQYNASPKSWIAENSTWYHLQQFQGLFSIKLANNYGNPDSHLWQSFAESGGGANNSTNPGDWKIDIGFYHWDNSSATCCYVKGIHAIVSMLTGRQGTNNQWTEFKVGWFQGTNLVANQTFIGWIEQNPLSQVTLWVNLWYSQNNASTSQGGRIAAYYTGMKNSGFLWWSSWSPLLQNDTATEVFVPLKDHAGTVMTSSLAQFTKVYFNMSRPGAPAVHTGQVNFQVITRAFQIETFLIASGSMGGIDTPSFSPAVVPIIQNTGFFSPIIRALQQLATWFVQGLTYVGNTIWAGLGSQFPWFTNFWSQAATLIVSFAGLLSSTVGYLEAFLAFIPSLFGPLQTLVNVIGSAWGFIQSAYSMFPASSAAELILLFILLIFCDYIFTAVEKGDTMAFVKLARGAWGIMNVFLVWTWAFAKLILDAIEGLIP